MIITTEPLLRRSLSEHLKDAFENVGLLPSSEMSLNDYNAALANDTTGQYAHIVLEPNLFSLNPTSKNLVVIIFNKSEIEDNTLQFTRYGLSYQDNNGKLRYKVYEAKDNMKKVTYELRIVANSLNKLDSITSCIENTLGSRTALYLMNATNGTMNHGPCWLMRTRGPHAVYSPDSIQRVYHYMWRDTYLSPLVEIQDVPSISEVNGVLIYPDGQIINPAPSQEGIGAMIIEDTFIIA